MADDELPEFVTASLTIETSVGSDGMPGITVTTDDDVPWWVQIGMLEAALLLRKHEATSWWDDGVDD